MRRELLKQLTWQEVVEIIDEGDALFEQEIEAGRNPNESFPTPETYYNEVLRRLRKKNNVLPPIEERYPGVLACAELATGGPLSESRTKENTLIRCFVAYRLHNEGYSYSDIGKMMKRDHSTITHLAYRMRDMLSVPYAYKMEVKTHNEFERLLGVV